jgi:hypothetical protein
MDNIREDERGEREEKDEDDVRAVRRFPDGHVGRCW